MQKGNAFAIGLALAVGTLSSHAAEPSQGVKISGTFHYYDSFDDGLAFFVEPDATSKKSVSQLKGHQSLSASNLKGMSKLLKIPTPQIDTGRSGNCWRYSGPISIIVDGFKKGTGSNEDGAYTFLAARVISVESKKIVEKSCES